MKKAKQLSLFGQHSSGKAFRSQVRFFGGALLKGRRKSIRPLSSKDSIHLVLRSLWAMGRDSFLASRNKHQINNIITHFAKRFGVRIYQRSINSNHIHLLLRITNRVLYRAFIKAVSGKIASHVMGQQSFKLFLKSRAVISLQASRTLKVSKRGDGQKASQATGFWQYRPFSRLVNWGKDFTMCSGYLKQNILEALGFVAYKPRKDYYSRWVLETTPRPDTC